MRLLILGAGAIGGYFGGRLLESGVPVTFLVREERAGTLRRGFQIRSPLGDAQVVPKVITQSTLTADFDLIILTCKSYDLDAAINSIAPAVGSNTMILPLLNGLKHLNQLDDCFGIERVLGGSAHLVVTREEDGTIRHFSDFHRFVFGCRHAGQEPLAQTFQALLSRANLESAYSTNIEQAMWEKFVFLTTLASSTCAMRGGIGDILATARGKYFIEGLFAECVNTAAASGFQLQESTLADFRRILFDRSSRYTSSMLRDMQGGLHTEADHILGDMFARAERQGVSADLLGTAYSAMQMYERARAQLR